MGDAQNVLQPLPTIEEASAEFQSGVSAALRAWSALRTAVQSEWGGIESRDKAEYLRNYIFEAFDYRLPKCKLDIDELEDNLAIYMEEEFSIVLEDDSEKELAHLIWQLYQSCGKGDFTLSRRTVEMSLKATSSSDKVTVQCDSDDESDDEMVVSDSNIQSNEYLFGVPHSELAKNAPAPTPREPKPEPIVDDDGFTMVTKKR